MLSGLRDRLTGASGALGAAALVAVGLSTYLVLGRDGSPPVPAEADVVELTVEELLAYEEGFVAVARDVGRLIEVGPADAHSMKGAVGAVDRGELHGAALRQEARSFDEGLVRAASRLEALSVPPGLEEAQSGLLRALRHYRELARVLGRAADTDEPAELDALLDRAVALGGRADRAFDEASTVIQDHRRRLGLGATSELPDLEAPMPDDVEVVNP